MSNHRSTLKQLQFFSNVSYHSEMMEYAIIWRRMIFNAIEIG